MQWVTGPSGGNGTYTINFPIPFPTACLNAMTGSSNTVDGGTYEISIKSFTKTSTIVFYHGGGGALRARIFAIGY